MKRTHPPDHISTSQKKQKRVDTRKIDQLYDSMLYISKKIAEFDVPDIIKHEDAIFSLSEELSYEISKVELSPQEISSFGTHERGGHGSGLLLTSYLFNIALLTIDYDEEDSLLTDLMNTLMANKWKTINHSAFSPATKGPLSGLCLVRQAMLLHDNKQPALLSNMLTFLTDEQWNKMDLNAFLPDSNSDTGAIWYAAEMHSHGHPALLDKLLTVLTPEQFCNIDFNKYPTSKEHPGFGTGLLLFAFGLNDKTLLKKIVLLPPKSFIHLDFRQAIMMGRQKEEYLPYVPVLEYLETVQQVMTDNSEIGYVSLKALNSLPPDIKSHCLYQLFELTSDINSRKALFGNMDPQSEVYSMTAFQLASDFSTMKPTITTKQALKSAEKEAVRYAIKAYTHSKGKEGYRFLKRLCLQYINEDALDTKMDEPPAIIEINKLFNGNDTDLLTEAQLFISVMNILEKDVQLTDKDKLIKSQEENEKLKDEILKLKAEIYFLKENKATDTESQASGPRLFST